MALRSRRRNAFPASFRGGPELARFPRASGVAPGASKREARKRATVVLAGFRGFLLDLCATRERARIDGAVEAWIQSLDYLPAPASTAGV